MEEGRSIRVRALTGESVSLPISVDKTVAEFKHLLKQTFPVANRYPNFNLYHKVLCLIMSVLLTRCCRVCDFVTRKNESMVDSFFFWEQVGVVYLILVDRSLVNALDR